MIQTVTALINELGKIRDRFTSSDIPVSVDGKKLSEDMLRIFNNVDKMYKRDEYRN